uniref:2Fe-2S ferredoxin-type domain-containing protein n=1 Tax=Timema genevievae TaxID=629358 RepID=A0A7R9PKH2_TIMGE|nr:unnamed protein product [Timema genevievae]
MTALIHSLGYNFAETSSHSAPSVPTRKGSAVNHILVPQCRLRCRVGSGAERGLAHPQGLGLIVILRTTGSLLFGQNWELDMGHQMTLIKSNGERIKGKFKEGDSILDVVVNNSIDLDGYGACEGTLTCSTCHVILKQEDYDALPEKPTDEELDMLDLAYDLTETSRLGCQIILKKEMDGLEVKVPATINDARS